jgi:diaminopimelate decarboxylase/aspartate kinase
MKPRWVVLKFGGTSVSSAERWREIAEQVRSLLPGRRVWLVCSALSGISNALEQSVEEALIGAPPTALEEIRRRHESLAAEAGIGAGETAPVAALLDEPARLLEGIRLTREASPRLRARVLSCGELASTRLGEAILARLGVPCRWLDARDLLSSASRPGEQEASRYLDADVPVGGDRAAAERAAAGSAAVITQGFIARTRRGETCLLGRGGSDTSAALFAALLDAERLEIWTDVHGMFTADPRLIPSAHLIRRIAFREAEELAAMGAKVLHPRSIGPVRQKGIPLVVRNTLDPGAPHTRVAKAESDTPAVTAVVCRREATLVSVSTLAMWSASGFLAQVFAPFEELGISVDLVATSQSAVSVTLDRIPGGVKGEPFAQLIERLEAMGTVHVVHPCAVVSIVGRRIRTVLHELGPVMSVFREHKVHLISESSEDLNFSFVVDQDDAVPLVQDLHARLFAAGGGEPRDPRLGPTWEALEARRTGTAVESDPAERRELPAGAAEPWWRRRREELLQLVADGEARYVYDRATVAARAAELRRRLGAVGRIYYSMKANPHPAVLEAVTGAGLGLECVSAAEVRRAREVVGAAVPLLFTPNFCPVEEYALALELGAEVTVDGPDVLAQAPGTFAGTEIGVRVDPGGGLGHHEKVRTAGAGAKFGHPLDDFEQVRSAAAGLARIVGLHAHVGSGIRDAAVWAQTAEILLALRRDLPDLRWLDVGGGLAVAERPGQEPVDLDRVERALRALGGALSGIELRMEPGRWLVSEAGVLIAPVTQVRRKGGVGYAGIATGMNSLLRPALYGAWHAIHNLTRLDERPSESWHVVGPICESGDVLGRDRLLPPIRPGDVLLLENCGAYGAVMSSSYNLRAPARETVLEGS